MKDETILVLIGIGAVGLFALRKPLSDLTSPTGDLIKTVNRAASDVVNAGEGLVNTSGNVVKNIVERVTQAREPKGVSTKTTSPSVTVSKSNTIYTNPKSPSVSYSTSSAKQAIEVYQNPKIQNIATNLGNTTIYTKKAVSLPPSLLSQVMLK